MAEIGQLLTSLATLMGRHAVLRQRALYQGLLVAAFSLFWTAVPVELARQHGLSQTQIAVFALVGAIGAVGSAVASALYEQYGWQGIVLPGSTLPLLALAMFVLYGTRDTRRG